MLISTISKYSAECSFYPPAALYEIKKCERVLGVTFPDVLKDLLLESNGIHGQYELRLLWPIDEILKINQEFRSNREFRQLYMPFNSLLFFSDAGNGSQFAFPIQDGQIRKKDIFVWNHEDDSRQWVAPDLLKYFEWWLSGQISI